LVVNDTRADAAARTRITPVATRAPKPGSANEMPPRGGRRNRDAEVIDAAVDVFWRKGFAAASIQDVADQVGVLKGSLYHYIDSKEELLFRIFDESHRQAWVIVEEVSQMDGPPLERLRAYIERYLAWYLENLERVSLYFTEWRHLTGERRDTVIEQRHGYETFLRNLIKEAQKAGDVSSDLNLTHAMSYIYGGIQNAPVWYRREGPDSPAQIAASYADMTIGLVTGTTPRKRRRSRKKS
jgi:AcrR family transcriptional regulator